MKRTRALPFICTLILSLLCLLAFPLISCSTDYNGPASADPGSKPEVSEPARSADASDPDASSDVPASELPDAPSASVSSDHGGSEASSPALSADYKVSLAEWSDVQWEDYSNVYFTLKIPKGWKVEWQGNAQQLYWRAVKPDGTVGLSNLDHRYAAKDYNYLQTGLVDMYLANGTVQEFFETFYSNSADYFTVKNAVIPDNKATLQSIRPSTPIRDYQSLYAVFKENGMEGEGIYTAVVMESRDVWAGGLNYGLWEINCIFTEWAPLGSLVNWQPALSVIAQSFQYTSYYVQEWRSVLGTSASPDGQTNMGDSVLEAFEERSTADTILQEKRSDMIGEYERVVDNETGDIYRAYNGFLEDIGQDQTRYSPITDSQYADGFVGWIDK